MIAIDTNVLVRALTGDHPEQAERVRSLLSQNRIFVATTVLLETEWVLRRRFKQPKAKVVSAIRAFVHLPQVRMEHPDRIMRALDVADQGADFADALHLLAAEDCDRFVTFDRNLAKSTVGIGIDVTEP